MPVLAIHLLALAMSPASAAPMLDYAYFRDRVQPVFLKKRAGRARCVTCHEHGSPGLQPLAVGQAMWTEEQSRKNFDMWKLFVKPGEPLKSPLLRHPLAESAGGDHFHAGGKHWASQNDPEWQVLAGWVRGATVAGTDTGVRVLQSNSAGDDITVIDPSANRVLGAIQDIEVPHGLVISPDGRRIYVTNEAQRTLDVVDAKTLTVYRRIRLTGRPNNVDVSKDGSKVYVGIREEPGAVDVINTIALVKAKTVPVKGAIHNVYVTPDGKWAVAGSIQSSTINVIDVATDTMAWTLTLDAGIRPMAFTANADGSTKEIIVQLSNFHGFAVVDFVTRKETKRVTLPDPPGVKKETEGLQGSPSHGLAITPDGKLLWVASKWYGAVAAYSLPDYKFKKFVMVGSHPEWLTIPPDGKCVYVAIAGHDTTAVVDNNTLELVTSIPVGAVPKRITSGMLHTE